MASSIGNNKNMTDEERLALAVKLDNDLEEFIDGLEKRRYTEGWPEDRWEEEMDKHPFFMKTPPKDGDELHPLMEGIQQLKYDSEENTKEDLASTYKEDGNFYLKHKKNRMAIYSYTEGLNMKCENTELNSILYNNRSAAQFFLKNYRSSLGDAEKSLKLNPNYSKPLWRSALCCSFMERFDQCIQICDQILQTDSQNQPALDLRKGCQILKISKTRDARKKNAADKKKSDLINKTLKEIEWREVKFEEQSGKYKVTEELIKPRLGPLEDFPVHLDDAGGLVWPAAFCYPEFLFSDFQQKLSEEVVMYDVLSEMFAEKLDCDKKHIYRPYTLNVYYENRILGMVFKINVTKTIREIISEKNFLVTGGCLTFYVVPKLSDVENDYVKKIRHPLTNV